MSDPIMVYSAFMRMEIERLNSIANNTSNVNSPGYLQKTSQINTEKFLALLNGSGNVDAFDINQSRELGTLKITGRALDVALASNHWFVVNLNGEDFLTRNGNFQLTADGQLMLGEFAVQGESGALEGITQGVRFHGDGQLFNGGTQIGKLMLVELSKNSELEEAGNGVYRFNGEISNSGSAKVLQGALVNSNVKLEADMTKMIEVTRQIESIQRAISAYDDVLDIGINQLGN